MQETATARIDRFDTASTVTGPGIRVLVLDDDSFDRKRIRRMGRETGMRIQFEEAGTLGALKVLLDSTNFDVILLDYRLGASDGLEALDMVRSHPINADCPTIMISGAGDDSVAARAMALGCSDYLEKARLSADRLRLAVEIAIDNGWSRAEGRDLSGAMREASPNFLLLFRDKLQPEIAALVRNIREMRATSSHPEFELDSALKDIDERSVALWSLLARLDRQRPN